MTLQDRLAKYLGKTPDTARAVFVARNATVIGDVTLGALSSVWYGAVLRGDINSIVIGEGTNVQDGAIVHLADNLGVRVGNYTTIGHAAIIHACDVGNECLIGMGATVLDGAQIGNHCIVGANTLVTQRFIAPPGSMILGSPGKVVRPLTAAELASLRHGSETRTGCASLLNPPSVPGSGKYSENWRPHFRGGQSRARRVAATPGKTGRRRSRRE